MKLITRDTDYAIRAFSCIAANSDSRVTVKDLAAQLDIPGPFLRKILQILNKGGFLRSFKGKNGGFVFKKDPWQVTVLDLVELFQGTFCISEHVFRGKTCPQIKTCFLKRRLDELEEKMKRELSSITIGSLIKNRDR